MRKHILLKTNFSFLCLLVLFCVFFTGCKKKEPEPVDNSNPFGDSIKSIWVYSLSEDTYEKESFEVVVPVDVQLEPGFIVRNVVSSLPDEPHIRVSRILVTEDAVYVDFYSEYSPALATVEGYEEAVLDSIAQSILDNLDQYSCVYFLTDGEIYKSGSLTRDMSKPYLKK